MKLKPCPFCGGNAELWDTEDVQYPYQIVCMSCFCGTDEKTYKESAIEAWNRREPIDKIVEQLKKMEMTDIALHKFMKEDYGKASGRTEKEGYRAFYHECGLYSVRKIKSGVVSLAYASSPYDAIEIVKKGGAV